MFDQIRHSFLRAVIALVVCASLFAVALLSSASHDPVAQASAQAERHAQLAVAQVEHGHIHASGMDEEASPGHVHGHNPLDHSHDSGSPPFDILLEWDIEEQDWLTVPVMPSPLAVLARLERPPKM